MESGEASGASESTRSRAGGQDLARRLFGLGAVGGGLDLPLRNEAGVMLDKGWACTVVAYDAHID